jgi:formate hydrogenlyase subunit 6
MEKFGTMFPDISKSLFRKPVTQRYPSVTTETPERLRGRLEWDPQSCTGCGLCAMDCPAFALEMTVLDRKARRYVMTYHLDRCAFCGQCLVSCKQNSLSMAGNPWELAALTRESFLVRFGDTSDIEQFLAGKPNNETSLPE